jgi:hypothetical protein
MRFSKTTKMFYPESIHYSDIPVDVVLVTDDLYQKIIDGESHGMIRDIDENGLPILVEPKNDRETIDDLRKKMVLSAAEARRRLAAKGLLLRVIETINAMPDDSVLKINWEYETVFKRLDSNLVDFCTQTLGMTDGQIDELFTA